MVINLKKNNVFNIVVIGAGNVGTRHIESLLLIDIPTNIFVIDQDFNSIKKTKKIYKNSKKNKFIKSINFFENISKINFDIDLAIISTNSNVRKSILKKMVIKNNIKNLLIEKVAFQSSNDFKEIMSLLKRKKIQCWVNLAKRIFPLFQKLKIQMNNKKKIIMNASSGNFDLGCNTIHYLDLFYFLTKSKIKSIDMNLIDKKIYKSKRKGYIDFNGTLKITTLRGDQLNITNFYGIQKDHILEISNQKFYYLILPYHNKYYHNNTKNKLIEKSFYQPKQSEMTSMIAKKILLEHKCDLPDLKESFITHKPMLDSFIEHINLIKKTKIKYCKIT